MAQVELANRRLQPLGHSSLEADMPDAGATRKRQFRCREANKIVKSVWLDIGPTADAARGTAVRKDALPEHDRTCALQLGRLLAATDALLLIVFFRRRTTQTLASRAESPIPILLIELARLDSRDERAPIALKPSAKPPLAPAARRTGTDRDQSMISNTNAENAIAVACYLCNTAPKTV